LRPRLGRRFSADGGRPSGPAKSFVLMANDADRKSFRALAVEGRANRAVLGSPQRRAARQCGILRHLFLERETLVRRKAIVHVGVQVRDAPSLDHLTTRKCGAALASAAGTGERVKAATRSRAFVSRAMSVANEMSRAEAASWWVKPARTTINSGSLSSKGRARTAAAIPISPERALRWALSTFSSHAASPSSRASRRTCRRCSRTNWANARTRASSRGARSTSSGTLAPTASSEACRNRRSTSAAADA
jgi:hypothetical protein